MSGNLFGLQQTSEAVVSRTQRISKKPRVQKLSFSLFFLINQDNKVQTDRQLLSVQPQKVFELKVKKTFMLFPLHHSRLQLVQFSSSSGRKSLLLFATKLFMLFAGGFSQDSHWGAVCSLSLLLDLSEDQSTACFTVLACIKINSSFLSCNFIMF